MGTEFFYANEDKKQYISADDNGKYPVNQAACMLFELLQGPWNGDRIRVYGDNSDLPWDEDASWTAVAPDIEGEFYYLALGYPSTNNDPEDVGKYVYIRVHDDRTDGNHKKLMDRIVSALKTVL